MSLTVQQIVDLPTPNWDDSGRKVKFTLNDISQEGILVYTDCFFDGCDEFPEFDIELENGAHISMFTVVWEYVE